MVDLRNSSKIIIDVKTHFKRFRESDFPGGNKKDQNLMTDAVEKEFHDKVLKTIEDFIHGDEFETRILNHLEDESLLPKDIESITDLGAAMIEIRQSDKKVSVLPPNEEEILECKHEWDGLICKKCGCSPADHQKAYNKKKHNSLNNFI